MIHDETIFWIYILYNIGSIIIEKTDGHEDIDSISFYKKLFCGYWILYYLAIKYDGD